MWNNFRYSIPLHIVLVLTNWLPDNIVFLRLRGWLAHFFIGKCGKDLRLGRNVTFYNPANIAIGSNVYIAYGCWFSANATITIEDEVTIGPYNVFASGNHSLKNGSFRYGESIGRAIRIEKGCWIGAHCTITAGSTIRKSTCIGANSITRNEIQDRSLYAGIPAKFIKKLEEK